MSDDRNALSTVDRPMGGSVAQEVCESLEQVRAGAGRAGST